jgi:hypothetical protein
MLRSFRSCGYSGATCSAFTCPPWRRSVFTNKEEPAKQSYAPPKFQKQIYFPNFSIFPLHVPKVPSSDPTLIVPSVLKMGCVCVCVRVCARVCARHQGVETQVVQFRCPANKTKFEIRNYLESIYGLEIEKARS